MKKFLSVLIPVLFIVSCRSELKRSFSIQGNAQGTTYQINYFASESLVSKNQIDSVLRVLDLSLSTYVPESIISRVNRNETGLEVDLHFENVFRKAVEVSEKTKGYFDITVAPIINAYGFGFTKKEQVTGTLIDSLVQNIGFEKIRLEAGRLVKENPKVLIDFNAIAQGYSVDVLGRFLESRKINDYMVELGGEVVARGRKNNGTLWKIGIDKPTETSAADRILQATVELDSKAMATSGNYRKFYEEDGRKYSHIIDPHTGYPAKNNLLSASVFAEDCMTADAYATAFMVMGLEKSKSFLTQNPDLKLEVFFVYDEGGALKTYTSKSLIGSIREF